MSYCDRIDVSEGIDVNKTSASKECDVCLVLSLDQMSVIDVMIYLMMSVNHRGIAILNIKGSDYCCIISLISKIEAINLIQNSDLTKKSRTFRTKNLF